METGVERRVYPRHELETPIMYIKHNSATHYGARLCNYSKGGINIESPFSLDPGADICIKMKSYPPNIYNPDIYDGCRGKVKWCREVDGLLEILRYEIGVEYKDKFWKKSYDEGLVDFDPKVWETSYVDAIRPSMEKNSLNTAIAYMGTEISFADLDLYSNHFAQMLLSCGFDKGDIVGINLPNIPEYLIAWLGTLKAGCVVSGVSPLLSAEEMEFQLKDSKARGLVTLDAFFARKFVDFAMNLPALEVVVTTEVGYFLPKIKRFFGNLLGRLPKGEVTPIEGKQIFRMDDVINKGLFSEELPVVNILPDDLMYVQYTGGTTGPPKGVMLNNKNILSNMLILQDWVEWQRGMGVALSGFPFFHMAGMAFNLGCVYSGWTQVLIPNPRDTGHICKEFAKYKPRLLVNVPTLYQLLLEEPKFRALDFSNLEICASGAAPFPEASQKLLEEIVGKGKLLEVYGMTETAPLITANPFRGESKLGSIGLPIMNTDIVLKDPSTGRPVALGGPGEICVKGPQVMVGYFNKPDETKRVFDESGYMHTGDIAIQDDKGFLRIVDRLKDMIIVGGFKVFSQKVEEVLAGHPAIDNIAIIGVPDAKRPGSEIVKACLTLALNYDFDDGEKILKEGIIRFARDRLAPYEVPKIIQFMDTLPFTAIGKVDKKQLREQSKMS